MTWEDARRWRGALGNRRLVLTNGVFDLVHPGHVDVLLAARGEGDALMVAVNSDDSVRRLKGPTRPVRGELDRLYVIAALEMVDVVVLFQQDTPLELIRMIEPDILVKGGDYSEGTVIGASEVRARGGKVVIVPLTPGHSTTAIVEKLRGVR
jgi:D-beta-D-heptose 7-phosphate kinase/D-beta-D-heptose 1-phosphate adenosyltransferase